MYWPNVLFLMLLIFPDSFDPMFLCIWTQCVLTHGVLTHCVRTQCGAQKCLAYKKKLAKSTFAICSLCCKVLQLYGSLCSLWGGRKSLLLLSLNFRALLICCLSFCMTCLNVLCASNVDVCFRCKLLGAGQLVPAYKMPITRVIW